MESDDELRAKLHDSRVSKAERDRARAVLAERGAAPGARASTGKKKGAAITLLVVAGLGAPILTIFSGVGVALAIRAGGAEAFEIDGPSGAPNFQHRDRVVVDKSAYGLFLPFTDRAVRSWAAPRLGDVAIIHEDGNDVLKRVIGLPGDTIAFENGTVVRNGEPLPRRILGPASGDEDGCSCVEETLGRRSHTILVDLAQPAEDAAPVRVPDGHAYVLGDHRSRSFDSRNFGTVAFEQFKGRVGAHYYRASSRIGCPAD